MGNRLHSKGLATSILAVWTAVGLSGVPDARAQSPMPPPSIQPWSATPAGPPLAPKVGLPSTGPVPAWEAVESASRLGRMALVVGAAQLWDASQGQWVPLESNRPLSGGDRIRTERDARLELQVGSLVLMMGPQSDLAFAQLDDAGVQARLQQGHVVARVRTAQWARELVLDTAELQLRPGGPGLFRVDRDLESGGRSAAAALRGSMTVVGAGSRHDLASGQRLEVMGPAAGGTVRRTMLLQDDFAAWVAARDGVPDAPASPVAAVLPEITGMDQLERHGRWESHPDIGWVWVPLTVAPAWEPFRDGRWVWLRPGGWTWIDDAPWGFAPSNYGRWVQWRSRWVWAPSPIRYRPPVPPPVWANHPQPHGHAHRDDRRWGRDDERRVRIPRVEPVLPALPSGESAVRPPPDRRHGFERREAAPPVRPERVDRPPPGDRVDQPNRGDRTDRSERQRQMAQ